METKTRTIVTTLASHGENGCGLISLSLETGISQDYLRAFLKQHNQYCASIDNYKFKINRRAENSKSLDDIIRSIEQTRTEKYIKGRVNKAFCLGVIVATCIPVAFNFLFYLYELWF